MLSETDFCPQGPKQTRPDPIGLTAQRPNVNQLQ